jgi:hypothetical protein
MVVQQAKDYASAYELGTLKPYTHNQWQGIWVDFSS